MLDLKGHKLVLASQSPRRSLEGDGLLTENVQTAVEGILSILRMQEGGQSDVEDIQFLVLHHLIVIGVVTDLGIFLHVLGTDVAHRDQFRILVLEPRGNVTQGDTADAEKTDFQFAHNKLPPTVKVDDFSIIYRIYKNHDYFDCLFQKMDDFALLSKVFRELTAE